MVANYVSTSKKNVEKGNLPSIDNQCNQNGSWSIGSDCSWGEKTFVWQFWDKETRWIDKYLLNFVTNGAHNNYFVYSQPEENYIILYSSIAAIGCVGILTYATIFGCAKQKSKNVRYCILPCIALTAAQTFTSVLIYKTLKQSAEFKFFGTFIMTLWLLDVALEVYLLILFALTMASSQYNQIIRDPIRDPEAAPPGTDDPPCYQLATKKDSCRLWHRQRQQNVYYLKHSKSLTEALSLKLRKKF